MSANGGAVTWWRRLGAVLPMRLALVTVAGVWLLGCVWSFQEQTEFAAYLGFVFPRLLPLVIDGFAVSMATVAWAASLDARPAVAARLATLVAVGASSASNGVWAWLRVTHSAAHNPITVTVAVAVPVLANLAFEVLLAELRRQVQRRRGMPAPVAVPYPRVIRLVLAPVSTFTAWRRHVLDLTATTPHREPDQPAGELGGARRPAEHPVRELPGHQPRQLDPPPTDGQAERVESVQSSPAEGDHPRRVNGVHLVHPEGVQPERSTDVQPDLDPGPGNGRAVQLGLLTARERAAALAQSRLRRDGALPSVRDLATHAGVAIGTAQGVLRGLRQQPHVINSEHSDANPEDQR